MPSSTQLTQISRGSCVARSGFNQGISRPNTASQKVTHNIFPAPPAASARRIIENAARSFTDPAGLLPASHFRAQIYIAFQLAEHHRVLRSHPLQPHQGRLSDVILHGPKATCIARAQRSEGSPHMARHGCERIPAPQGVIELLGEANVIQVVEPMTKGQSQAKNRGKPSLFPASVALLRAEFGKRLPSNCLQCPPEAHENT